MQKHDKVLETLQAISIEMINLGLWQDTPPESSALASTQPFCVDTLSFCEWLQWILIPRLENLASTEQALPKNSDIATMAGEALKLVDQDTDNLQRLIAQLDSCLRVAH